MKFVSNPPNRYEPHQRERLEASPPVALHVLEEDAREILSRNDSPDLPFRWSLNPYRGCFHACVYCYARPSHEYWGWGAGTDFESKLVAKPRAADRLRATFMKPSWKGELIVFSGNTDCYQPLEASYGLTRACLEICAEFTNPVAIITKSGLITRDLSVLQQLHERAWLRVYFSIPFLDEDTARKVEPQAPSIKKRFEAMRTLAHAGIPTGVSIAPVIPGLNEEAIPGILARAREAGATTATFVLLRLPNTVEPVFFERMQQTFPSRVHKIMDRLRAMRNGAVSDPRFFARHHGTGAYWETIERLFEMSRRKVGMAAPDEAPIPETFRRPGPVQTSLF